MPAGDIKVGIRTIGVYLPKFRISGKVLSEAWRRPMGRTVKSVPNHDEDSLTMAVGALVNTKDDTTRADALYFATTTAPYKEKSSASLIATAADLPPDARTLDFGGSLRAGTSAFISAAESILAGRSKDIIVAAADTRFAEPGSDLEVLTGAGAAALEISADVGSMAFEVIDFDSGTGDLMDYWRKADDRYVRHSDLKFAMIYGATRTVSTKVLQFLEKRGRNIAEYNKVIISVPDPRSTRSIAKQLKLSPEQVQDNFMGKIGLIGNAQPFIMLADAASNCPEGSDILMANYGDGCDIIELKKTGKIKSPLLEKGIDAALADAVDIPNYTKYLSYHDLIQDSTQQLTTEPFSSPILAFREGPFNIRLQGKRCKKCGTIQTLDLKVCPHCMTREDFESHKLSKNGVINTFTQEYYYPTPEPPVTMAVIDLEGGGRLLAQMTDTDPEKVEIGMPVELTFRRLHQGAEFWNYCWKCRPVDKQADDKGGGS
jgi:3-hydroxy-3-methylglutaryl CoA synthase